jgi:hypothetical protein
MNEDEDPKKEVKSEKSESHRDTLTSTYGTQGQPKAEEH